MLSLFDYTVSVPFFPSLLASVESLFPPSLAFLICAVFADNSMCSLEIKTLCPCQGCCFHTKDIWNQQKSDGRVEFYLCPLASVLSLSVVALRSRVKTVNIQPSSHEPD